MTIGHLDQLPGEALWVGNGTDEVADLVVGDFVDQAVAAFVSRPDAGAVVAERIGISRVDADAWLARTRFAHGEQLDATMIDTILAQLRAAGATP